MNRSPLRILFVTTSVPYPPQTGGQIRSWYFLRYLASKGRVTLVSIGKPEDVRPHLGELEKYCAQVFLADPTKFTSLNDLNGLASVARRFQKLARLQPWLLDDFVDPEIKRQIQLSRPDQYDLIVVRFGVMAYHFVVDQELRKFLYKTVIDVDDISTIMLARKLRAMKWGYQKIRMSIDYWFLSHYYRKLRRAFACFAISEKDRNHMLLKGISNQVFVIPNVFEVNGRAAKPSAETKPEILFCGMMSYPPNQDATFFFCEKIFPKVRSVIADAHLTIVGKNTPEKIMKLGSLAGVTVAGSVPSMDPFYEQAAVVVVPLLNGAGSRIKILEAMAYQRPVVSTSVGAEGLDVTDGENILIVDDPDEFARQCIDLIQDSKRRVRIASSAYDFVQKHYDLPVFYREMDKVLESMKKVTYAAR